MLKIYGTAGTLDDFGVEPHSILIGGNSVPLRSEHTTGDFGMVVFMIKDNNLNFEGIVFRGNETYVKKFSRVSAGILVGHGVYSINEVSLTDAPKFENTAMYTEEIKMADNQSKPYKAFSVQPSVAGTVAKSAEDYDREGFENFNGQHLASRGFDTVTEGGVQ